MPLERRLKYVFVDQVISVLVDILQDTGSGSSTMAGGEVVRTRRPPQASTDPATLTGRPRRVSSQVQGAATAPVGYEDKLLPPEETAPPLSVLIGKTRLVAHALDTDGLRDAVLYTNGAEGLPLLIARLVRNEGPSHVADPCLSMR